MEKKKVILLAGGIFALTVVSLCAILFSRALYLNNKLTQTKQMAARVEEEAKRMQAEKEKIAKENEKLQADAVSYLGVNASLQKEKDSLQSKMDAIQKTLEKNEDELGKAKLKLNVFEKKVVKEQGEYKVKLQKERDELKASIQSMEEALKKERGLYHYNLAVAYTQAKFYDEAIDAYEKSLTFDANNADAHYNMGLLYFDIKQDEERAAEHYRIYLKLKPDAEDKDEVSALLAKLK